MLIDTDKTKILVTLKEPTRYKLKMKELQRYKYLGTEVTSNGNL